MTFANFCECVSSVFFGGEKDTCNKNIIDDHPVYLEAFPKKTRFFRSENLKTCTFVTCSKILWGLQGLLKGNGPLIL